MISIARPQLGPEEEQAVLEVMRSGALAQGENVHRFEAAFATTMGARFGVATCNGTAALHLALLAHGIGQGDQVITSPLTFIATANAIRHTGARPVFADVDETLNIDVESVERLIGPRTRAIVPVHLHGNPCDLEALTSLANARGLKLIQDACQAVGALIHGRALGAFGTAVYSLYATKNITTGEGGMVITNDPDVANTIASLRHQAYGSQPYVHDAVGYNFRMTEMEAAIGLVQLRRLPAINGRRRQLAAAYDVAVSNAYPRPRVLPGHHHVYHQYTLRVPPGGPLARDEVREHLERAGIGSGVYYPVPVHLQPAYRVESADVSCPRAERAAREMFSIPVHPAVSDSDCAAVAEHLNAILASPVVEVSAI